MVRTLPSIDKASLESLHRTDPASPRGGQLFNSFATRLREELDEVMRFLRNLLPDCLLDFVITLSLMLHPDPRERLDAKGVTVRLASLMQSLL